MYCVYSPDPIVCPTASETALSRFREGMSSVGAFAASSPFHPATSPFPPATLTSSSCVLTVHSLSKFSLLYRSFYCYTYTGLFTVIKV